MSRLARVVAPGVPHHVTQRGNRRQTPFFGDGDDAAYLDILGFQCIELNRARRPRGQVRARSG